MKSSVIIHQAAEAFNLRTGAYDSQVVHLVVQPVGSRLAPVTIWTRRFDTVDDRQAFLDALGKGAFDPLFLGRLTMIFGEAAVDALADRSITTAREIRAEELEEAERKARNHFVVHLYARQDKRGRHILELQRKSATKAEWSVAYDRTIERDRLCDWLRWQKDRFVDFLDHVAEHGSEALSRMLTDEMFVTERRVKKEGRGAGGARPLRMWRGD